jgi:hypothetical protein
VGGVRLGADLLFGFSFHVEAPTKALAPLGELEDLRLAVEHLHPGGVGLVEGLHELAQNDVPGLQVGAVGGDHLGVDGLGLLLGVVALGLAAHIVPLLFLPPAAHGVRFDLEVRGDRKITIKVHDSKHKWLGPSLRFRLKYMKFPMLPPFDINTYVVFSDGLSELSLCQWLTVILAQRYMLTEEEERYAVEGFFVKGSRTADEASVRLEAYEFLKRRFVIPVGGNPSFPLYYQSTLRMLRVRRRVELRSVESPVHGGLVSLKELRWIEPNLHRALLDRISQGKVAVVKQGKFLWVRKADADRIDDERIQNAAIRQPKRLPGVRAGYITQLVNKGMNRSSATRKIKRWINELQMTEAEINSSIAKGRVVRLERHPR